MNKEAIQFLYELLLLRASFSDFYGDMGNSEPYEEAVEIAREAIEKQMLKKPREETYFYGKIYYCPLCEKSIGKDVFVLPSFCQRCGQALDWSGENVKTSNFVQRGN